MKKKFANVAIKLPDGSMEGIKVYNYCNPELMGVMLLRAYRDRLKIWQAIQLGNLVSIGWDIGEKVKDIEKFKWDGIMRLQNKQCLAHIRDFERCPIEYGTKKHKDKMEWSVEYADWHRYYFVSKLAPGKRRGRMVL